MKRLFLSFLIFVTCALNAGIRTGGIGVAVLKAANLNSTADQVINLDCTSYVIRRVVVKNASVSLTLAVGGIYTAASKGGNAVVAATQVYSGLTSSTKFMDLTLASIATTDIRTEAALYLSLTTAQGSAATADVYIYYDCVD